MSAPSYPLVCSLNHVGVQIDDAAALRRHHQGKHPGVPIKTLLAASTPGALGQAALPVANSGGLSLNFTIDRAALAQVQGSFAPSLSALDATSVKLQGGHRYDMFSLFLEDLGKSREVGFEVNSTAFMCDMLIHIFHTRGSNSLDVEGTWLIYPKVDGEPVELKTTEVLRMLHAFYKVHFNITFNIMDWAANYEVGLWDNWNTTVHNYFAVVKLNGTRDSNNISLTGGEPVPPWVVVPNLFNNHICEFPQYVKVRNLAVREYARVSRLKSKRPQKANVHKADVVQHVKGAPVVKQISWK